MSRPPITNVEPLQPEYIPSKFVDRDKTRTALSNLLAEDSSRNIHLQGPRGTGKTHLTLSALNQLSNEVNTCYIDCTSTDTQYKALKQIYESLTNEKINSGHHTSDLQRKIEERTSATQAVVVLDEIDFLLLNDGDSLLYYLSRTNNAQINVVTISSQITDLQDQVEERTYSSLQPYPLQLEPYNGEEIFQILVKRAQQALKPQSLQRQALTYIASTTQNTRLGLQWLKTAAKESDSLITETHVQQIQKKAYKRYTAQLLDQFSKHHQMLYQAITELSEEKQDRDTVRAGEIYQRYQELTDKYDEETTLSNRRISDYLKHLELLDLIQAEYHYGGKTGKTREITLNQSL
jgi:orc1/cdc6 family replication initiation protein